MKGFFSTSKGFTMNMTLLFMQLAMLTNQNPEAVEYVTQGVCSDEQQRNILGSVTSCKPRETLIHLTNMINITNMSNVIQVIPDYASVNRCGGSCDMYSHSCIPTTKRLKRLDVMLVLSDFASVQTETQCGYVEVEEHLGCQCNCPVQPHHCKSNQYYDRSSCRCVCQNQNERNQCILNGMQWDPINCMCICPVTSWKVCSTGYIFDYRDTCQCIPTSTTASMGLLVAIVILIVCVVITAVGGVLMYRRQTGIFRAKSRRSMASATPRNLSNYDLVLTKDDVNAKI